MEFRPCIDIHNGKVKQIVGGSLSEENNSVRENFVSAWSAADYAKVYKKLGVKGGHVIILNSAGTPEYNASVQQAKQALCCYPRGLQVGGGITDENAGEFLEAGASHVIVTSYVFKEGRIHMGRLKKMVESVGRKRLVLDLSCRRRGADYYVVTDRWQRFTEMKLTPSSIDSLASYCDEFLIHAVDVEGKISGIEEDLVRLMAEAADIPITYAGGISSFEDIKLLGELGKGRINFTIGSALDLFGGKLSFERIVSEYCNTDRRNVL